MDAHGFRADAAARRSRREDRRALLPAGNARLSGARCDRPRGAPPSGELLRLFHSQASRAGGREAEERITRRTREWLDAEHRIAGDVEARLREALDALDPGDPPLVPTHGDWQPRNWLVDGDEVRVIDFGRFAFRAAATDLAWLAAQEWRESPVCEEAFLDGYGGDPRHPEHWLLVRLREAIGTAVWAFQVGDANFEAQGHRMIAEILEEL
ncbi:phosphotransferase family protein [Microbacterium sp. NIBRBAC000506063]|uniref:phosphotransferase family protein n=1 Tax=Microbacterium sp. NIBRBAC000506063 TaxID=2734618 RepID=UPI001BB65FA0|nr:phosphotransferase [Microbacterium sp. NIBRBAC000506063]QTV79529.1 phosphotransferase [Microbacterium sp. NIBRBAC000506063]